MNNIGTKMVRFLAMFAILYTSLYGDGMIISFEEIPKPDSITQTQLGVESPDTISRSPPRPDDLPVYPPGETYDVDGDSPCSIKGPRYFRKKSESLEVVPSDIDNRSPLEVDTSREIKKPAFRGREPLDPAPSTFPEDYREAPHSLDRPDSFFEQDLSHPDGYNPRTPAMGGYEKTIMHTALVVLGFILFLLLLVWLLRKFNKGKVHSAGREISVLERKPLSHKSVLYLVKVNNKKFLIAESQLEVKAMRPVNIELEED